MVILASMNEFEDGAGPIQPSLLRRLHKWHFSVTPKTHGGGFLPVKFSGEGLLKTVANEENRQLAAKVDGILKTINKMDQVLDETPLSSHGIPAGYFVDLFKREETVKGTDVVETWELEVSPILNKLTNEQTVSTLTKTFKEKLQLQGSNQVDKESSIGTVNEQKEDNDVD